MCVCSGTVNLTSKGTVIAPVCIEANIPIANSGLDSHKIAILSPLCASAFSIK